MVDAAATELDDAAAWEVSDQLRVQVGVVFHFRLIIEALVIKWGKIYPGKLKAETISSCKSPSSSFVWPSLLVSSS